MNLYDYIKKYGDISFKEKEENDIDISILTLLTYMDFTNISGKDKVRLDEVLIDFVNNYTRSFAKRGVAQKETKKLALALIGKKRFKDILVYDYIYKVEEKEQFCAVTMKLPNGVVCVLFEGTDHKLAGWEEDCQLMYEYPVKSHIDGTEYLNNATNLFERKIIVAGHSKGGNTALVASMNSNFFTRNKIKKIYSFDGPGLRQRELESKEYKRIKNKFYHLVPNYSFVGLLMRHDNTFRVVESSRRDLICHMMTTWKIEDDKFKYTTLSTISKNLDKSIILWLENHDDEQRKKMVDGIFELLYSTNLEDLNETIKIKNILALLKNTRKIDKESKDLFKSFLMFNIKYCLDNRKDQ